MYELLKHTTLRRALPREAPPAAASMAVAQALYRFHSFTREVLAFLPTWYAASLPHSRLLRIAASRGASPGA